MRAPNTIRFWVPVSRTIPPSISSITPDTRVGLLLMASKIASTASTSPASSANLDRCWKRCCLMVNATSNRPLVSSDIVNLFRNKSTAWSSSICNLFSKMSSPTRPYPVGLPARRFAIWPCVSASLRRVPPSWSSPAHSSAAFKIWV